MSSISASEGLSESLKNKLTSPTMQSTYGEKFGIARFSLHSSSRNYIVIVNTLYLVYVRARAQGLVNTAINGHVIT